MTRSFTVLTYWITLGYRETMTVGGFTIQYQGRFSALGGIPPGGIPMQLTVYGLHPRSLVPTSAYCDPTETFASIFVPFADLHQYVDLVRNERPVYGHLSVGSGGYLATGMEPTGEQEGH
jgi:hypothetical protein